MKIILKEEDENILSTLDKNFKDVLEEQDLSKILAWLKTNLKEAVKHQKRRQIFAKLLNNLDERLEKALSQYKSYIQSTEVQFSAQKQAVIAVEEELLLILKIYTELVKMSKVAERFNSIERVIEILPLTSNLKLIRKTLKFISYYSKKFSFIELIEDESVKKELSRMVHNISMIGLHVNLYNPRPLSLIELLTDDAKFKEYNASQDGKFHEIKYKDSLNFEYYIPNLQARLQGEQEVNDNENVNVYVESLKAEYPNDSHYSICKKIIKEKRLSIEEGSPIFDALLFRIRLAQDFELYEKRVSIINSVLKALSTLIIIRSQMSRHNPARLYIYQDKNLLNTPNDVSQLLHLQATPTTHKNVIKMSRAFYSVHDQPGDAQNFLSSKFEHTGEFNLALKDLTSLELKLTDKETTDETEKASLDLRSLILPKESVLKTSILNNMLNLVLDFYIDKSQKTHGQEVENLSHLIPSIMSILQLPAAENFVLYSKKVIISVLRMVKLLVFNRNFIREFKIVETVLDFGGALFKLMIDGKKCYYQKNGKWEVFTKEEMISLILETISPFSDYLLPAVNGRYLSYLSRAEMAPTIVRKLAESNLMKCAVTYLQNNKEVDENLFEKIIKVTSDICRESQNLVPRLVESGLLEELFKKIRDNFHLCKSIGEVIGLVANTGLQAVGRDIAMKYKILELFFEAFTDEKYNPLFEKWLKLDARSDRNQIGELERVQSELNYICEYILEYSSTVSQELQKLSNFLVDQGTFKLKELGEIAAKENAEQTISEENRKNFLYYVCKLLCFLEIYSRYLVERRMRGISINNADLSNLLRLYATYRLFSSDFHLPQGRTITNVYEIIKKELNKNPQILEKIALEKLDNIEKIAGPLSKLQDFSAFLSFDVIKIFTQKKTIEALYTSKEASEHIFRFMRSLYQVIVIIEMLVAYKLGSAETSERILSLYMAYLGTTLKYRISIASDLFKEENAMKDSKEKELERLQKIVSEALDGNIDIFGRKTSFLTSMKRFLDNCLLNEQRNPKKSFISRFPEVVLQILGEFKQFKDASNTVEDQIAWVLKTQIIFQTLDQVTNYSIKDQFNARASLSLLSAFAFTLYEEGAFEVLAEKVYALLKFSKDNLNQPLVQDSEAQDKQLFLYNGTASCLDTATKVFEKFFYALELNGPVTFKGKKIEGIELQEYANCIWLNHGKLILPFFDLAVEVSKKANKVQKEVKEEEIKEAEPKNEEIAENKEIKEKEAEDKKEREKYYKLAVSENKLRLRELINLLFSTLGRVISSRQAQGPAASVKEAKKVDKAAEKVINDLTEMGYPLKVAELATRNIPFINIGLAIDWISSHPRECDKAEKEGQEGSKPGEKVEQGKTEDLSLGAQRLEKILQEDYNKFISEFIQEFNEKLLSYLFTFEGSERSILKFLKKMVEFQTKNNPKSNYSQRIGVIVLKIFKHNVNNFVKNTKFISSLKLPKTFDKNFGKDIVKQYTEANTTPLTKLQSLEKSLFWFIKLRSFIPHFNKNFMKPEFLNEIMSFYEQALSNTKEFISVVEAGGPETKEILQSLKRVNHSMMHIFWTISSGKAKSEPESSERKTDKSLTEEVEKKTPTTKESKVSTKVIFKPKKSPLEILINIVSLINTINAHNEQSSLYDPDAIHDLIEILLSFLNENQENKRQFLKQNGLNELLKIQKDQKEIVSDHDGVNKILKIQTEVAQDNQLFNDIVVLFVQLVEEPNLILASIEGKVKTYLTQKSLQTPDIPLTEFTNYFKNLSSRHRKLMIEVIQKICVIYAKEPDPVQKKSKGKKAEKEEKEEKGRSQSRSPQKKAEDTLKKAATLLGKVGKNAPASQQESKRFIKLKDTADVGKIECVRKSEKKKKASEEVDLTETSTNMPFKPSENVSQVLNILIENIVENFNKTVTRLADEKNKAVHLQETFTYNSLIKILALLCTEHPLLLPFVLNYNCSKHFTDLNETPISLLKKYKERTNFSFLSYYLRVINCIALDKLGYFLVSISSNRDTIIQNAEGEAVYLGEEIANEILKEIKDVLQGEISRPDFLDNADSIQTICSLGSLLLPLLQVKQTVKLILQRDEINNKDPELLLLYINALNKLKIKNYYKFQNVLPFVLEPLSILLQYYNYIIFQQADLSMNIKYMPKGILAKYDFAEMWRLISTNQPIEPADLQAGNRSLNYLRNPRGLYDRIDIQFGDQPVIDNGIGATNIRVMDGGGVDSINIAQVLMEGGGRLVNQFNDEMNGNQFIRYLDEIGGLGLRSRAPAMENIENDDQSDDDEEMINLQQEEEEEDDDEEDEEVDEEGNHEEDYDEIEERNEGEIRSGRDLLFNFGNYLNRLQENPNDIQQVEDVIGMLQRTNQEEPFNTNIEDDEEDTEKVNFKDILDSKTISGKNYPYTTKIESILKEDSIQNEDLANIKNKFIHLFGKLRSAAVTLTTNNPTNYEQVKPTSKGKDTEDITNVYMRVYSQLEDPHVRGGIRISNQVGQQGVVDLGLVERDLVRGLNFDTALQRHLGYGQPQAVPSSGLGADYNTFERGYLRENPIEPANAEELNIFNREILNSVEQVIPQPAETGQGEAAAEESESEEENEEEEKPAATTTTTTTTSANNLITSMMDAFAVTLRNINNTNANTNANAPAGEQQQQSQSITNPEQGNAQNVQEEQKESTEPVLNERPSGQSEEAQNVEEEHKEEPSHEEGGQEGESMFRLRDYGIDETFLQNCGIDMTVFDYLPDEEKIELVLQLLDQGNLFASGNVESQATNVNVGVNINQSSPVQSNAQNQNQNQNVPAEESKEENPASGEATTNIAQNLGSPLQPLNPDAGEQSQAQAGGQQAANAENTGSQQQQQQGGNAPRANEIPDIDPEILGNLDSFPEDLRNDILQQQSLVLQQNLLNGGAPADTGAPGDMDIATFLETLDPVLRQEIFISSDQNFIDNLPSHLAAEAEIVRNNRLNRFDIGDMQAQRNESIEPPLNFIEKTIKKEKKEQALNLEKREKLFESDEKLIESILKLLYIEPSQFSSFPFELLLTLAQHPRNEFRIFDTLMFLLKNSSLKDIKEGTQEGLEETEVFPPRTLHEKNRIIKDKEVIYEQVSPHILYILQCLTQTRSDYFVKDREESGSLDVVPSLKRNVSLDSIRNLKAEMEIRETHPLYDLLQLCASKTLTKNPTNVTLLANIIENICKNPNIFKTIIDTEEQSEETAENKDKKETKEEEEKEAEGAEQNERRMARQNEKQAARKAALKEEKEEIYLCKYKLDEQSVLSFCQLLYAEDLNNTVISKLSFIIGVFCQEKHNLDLFIKVMKEILYKVSLESNKFLQEKLLIFKGISGQPLENDEQTQNKLKSLLNEVVSKFKNQLLIRRIAKIIKFLYENTVKYLKAKQKYEQSKASKNKDKKTEEAPQRKGSLKDELFVKAREEIIKSLESIMLDDNLKTFWINVSECVHVINEKLSKSWDVQNLLNANVKPIIESFFIIHKILNDEEYIEFTKGATKPKATLSTVVSNEEDIDLLELEKAPVLGRGFSEVRDIKMDTNEMFTFICEKNKKVINGMIKQDLTLLNDSMSLITKKVPKILDFEIRRAYFEKELTNMRRGGSIRLRIKRERLMENSFNQLYSRNADELRRKLQIEFVDEEGMDAGGVAREWFLELSKQVFNANYNLFIPSANGNTFQPSLISDPANLNYFKFIGKFIAKALFDKQLLECYFTRSFYKHILGQPINYHDIEDVDPDYYKSLKWILENDITHAGLDLTFSYEFDKFGLIVVEDLIPNGRNIAVTEENKSKYVHLICNHKMARGIKAQVENFLAGFFELIPKNLIAIFDSKELELLISGLPDIDIVDLKENTEYHGYNSNAQVIKWFWEVMEDIDQTQKANFLQFVTGTSKVPLEGFSALKGISGPQRFQIHRAGDPNSLPTGHTCFNQLDLPEYATKEQLIEKLLLAITEGKEGFGFA